jgi:serine/threonine-protein kinase HipA
MKRCLYCYQELDSAGDYHEACSKKFFGKRLAPDFPYTEDQLIELAKRIIQSQIAITGVQAKLSLHVEKQIEKNNPTKFTIVDLWGGYILKLPSANYSQLPELEDVTMHLAEIGKLISVPHALFRLQSGKLAYVTKRIDRTTDGKKIHMEDMCQLTERLTEHKYRGSYEQIGKAIIKYSAHPGLDIINFFEQVVFSFLTGNADMHLKNFSLIQQPASGYTLAPAYDMVATALVVIGDDEELALTLNGKKRKLKMEDFEESMNQFRLDTKVKSTIFRKFNESASKWFHFLDLSFLEDETKVRYQELIKERMKQLKLIQL